MTGGWVLWAISEQVPPGSPRAPIVGHRGLQRAVVAFGLALLPVGLSHLAYVPETVGLVPAWLPVRNFWAYLTGAGQIACGLGILFQVSPRAAASFEAAMVSLFTLLVWLPFVVSKPTDRGSWTGFFISWTIGASAWTVAQHEGTLLGIERARRSVSQPSPGESVEERHQPRSEVRGS
jgi:uncharacterized membrane protein YphA (DoxX/SURF4 family)